MLLFVYFLQLVSLAFMHASLSAS